MTSNGTDWGVYQPFCDEAVAFALNSLSSTGKAQTGLLQIRRKLTVAQSILQLAASVREAEAEGGGVDPEEVRIYLQNILDAASFAKENQPQTYYVDMPDAPEDPDLRVFSYRPRQPARPAQTDTSGEIAYVVGEVSGRFAINRYANDETSRTRTELKPSATEVVAEALRRITAGKAGSTSTVRRHLTAETEEAATNGYNDGLTQREVAHRQG